MSAAKKNNQEKILEILSKTSKPMTAYQILGELKQYGINGPPTVYRSLEALQAQGHVHRIETLNAFIVCHHKNKESHPASFILCKDCGGVEEIHDHRMEALLNEWSKKLDFSVTQQTIELLGLCLECKNESQRSNVLP